MAVGRDLAQVGKAHRLSASKVDRHRHADVGDPLGAHLLHEAVELDQVNVALERMQRGRIVRLVDDHVVKGRTGQLLMEPRRGEVHVAGDVVTRLDQQLREEVLGAAPLVGGDQLLVAVGVADGLLQVIEVARAGVGLIAHHHAGPLAIAHRAGAGIGEEVDVDVLGAEQEGVVAGVADVALALGAGGHADRLDNLDLPRFGPAAVAHRSRAPGARHGRASGRQRRCRERGEHRCRIIVPDRP
ncbi:MAG: hypothetical protein V9E87_01495 [Gemmatimonadales bacterium]